MSAHELMEGNTKLMGISTEVPAVPTFDAAAKGQLLDTEFGPVNVTVQGSLDKPVIVTYHDIGLDHLSCFQGLLNFAQAQPLVESFCFIHVDAPGQHANAPDWDTSKPFPTDEQMAQQLDVVTAHFNVDKFVGLGAGAGGNILTLYAINNPKRVKGLILFGTDFERPGWAEWTNSKISTTQTRMSGGMTKWMMDSLLQTYFSPTTCYNNVDLLTAFREHLVTRINSYNLCLFAAAMESRTDIPAKIEKTLRVPVLWMYGSNSRCINGLDNIIPKFDASSTSRIEIWDAGSLVHEERPDQVVTPMILFLQGIGLAHGLKSTA